VASFYDNGWTQMVDVNDRPLTFRFDTRDPNRAAEPTGRDTRRIPQMSFERYTRDRERWGPRSAWPAGPQSGDWRTVIQGRDVVIDLTGYRSID
jgi:hypothetical protein